MGEYQSFNVQNDERALEISKILIEAAKETHALSQSLRQSAVTPLTA